MPERNGKNNLQSGKRGIFGKRSLTYYKNRFYFLKSCKTEKLEKAVPSVLFSRNLMTKKAAAAAPVPISAPKSTSEA